MRRDPMTEPLDDLFDSLRPVPPPDSERQAIYRAALLAQAREQATSAKPAVRRQLWARRWATAGALVSLVLVLLVGTSGAIYAADGAAPGDPLYGLDRAAESVRLRLTHNPQAAAGLLLALSTERLQEVQALSARGDRQHLPAALDNYGASISSLAQTLGSLDPAGLAALTTQVDEAMTAHEVQLGNLLLTAGAAPSDLPENATTGAPPTGEEEGSSPEGGEPPEADEPAGDCVGADPHPIAQTLAETYEVDYEEIMTWFCAGYGFGEIVHALQTSEVSEASPEELLALKTEMGGWGQVWQELGLIGQGRRPEDRSDDMGQNPVPSELGDPKKDKPEPAGPKPKEEKPDNPGQSKKNKP